MPSQYPSLATSREERASLPVPARPLASLALSRFSKRTLSEHVFVLQHDTDCLALLPNLPKSAK